MTAPAYRFGAYVLDPARRSLLRDGAPVTLPPKALDLIVYLIEQRERAVGRDELIAAVWGKVDITDNALGQVVLQARRALGDSGEGGQRVVRTVPRFGYRWGVPVQEHAAGARPDMPTTAPPAPRASPAGRRRPGLRLALAAVVLLAGAAVLWRAAVWRGAGPAAPDVQAAVVLPVDVEAPAAFGWVRLGVMDLVAQRLRAAGQAVMPSDSVVGLARRYAQADGRLDAAALGRASGAAIVVQAHAALHGERWQVSLRTPGGARGEGESADVIAAARSAADRLAQALGHAPAAAADADDLVGLLQQARAAILSEQLDAARRLLLAAGDDARARPQVRYHLAEIDFRAGRLDEAEQAFAALLAGNPADAPALRPRVLNALANIAYQRNAPDEVEAYSGQALDWLATHEDAAETGRALIGRASARSAQHRYDAALADFAQARIALEAAGDRLALARVDAYQGLLEVNRDRPAEALPVLRDAVERLRGFDAVVEELHARVGIVMAELAMLDPAAAAAQCARLDELAARVSDLRRRHYAGLVCADAALATGALGEAAQRLRRIREQARPPERTLLHPSRVQLHRLAAELALAVGDADQAAAEADAALALPAHFDSAGAWARIALLRLRAGLARGDAAAAATAAAAEPADAAAGADVRVYRSLALAAQADARGDARSAQAAFADALAAADASRIPADLLAAAQAYADHLLRAGDLERAAVVVGRVAPWSAKSYEAALLQVRLHRALDQAAPWQEALRRAAALAGERTIPAPWRAPRPVLELGDAAANGEQMAH